MKFLFLVSFLMYAIVHQVAAYQFFRNYGPTPYRSAYVNRNGDETVVRIISPNRQQQNSDYRDYIGFDRPSRQSTIIEEETTIIKKRINGRRRGGNGRRRQQNNRNRQNGVRGGNGGGTGSTRNNRQDDDNSSSNSNEIVPPVENGNRRQSGAVCRTRTGYVGVCKPRGLCYWQYGQLELAAAEACQQHNGQVGFCCPHDIDFAPNPAAGVPYQLRLQPLPQINLNQEIVNSGALQQAMLQADADIRQFFQMERLFIGELGQQQTLLTPAHFLQLMTGPPDENQQLLNLFGFRALQVTRALGRQLGLSPEQLRDGLSRVSLRGTRYERYCILPPKCQPRYRYRTIDGSCNNLRHPLWGKSLTQFVRLLPPEYSDGISELRWSRYTGNQLPLPRLISTEVLKTSGSHDAQFARAWNVMFMQFGQFLDHDITLGSSTRASTGEGLLCCNRTHSHGPLLHPACRPIYIPRRDPFYSRHNRMCNNFVRNAVGPKSDCTLGYREQTNVVTAFIDASMVYGPDLNRTRLVRAFRDGLLNTANIGGREWLPFDTMNNSLACSLPPRSRDRCVFSGDVRVNQQYGITSLQLLFLREHNRLARLLKQLNPGWDDETLFQEARRIVGAEMQHITYNEYLPEALGRNVMRQHRLSLQPSGYCLQYDQRLDPSIINEFAGAAFRWHTLVQKFYYFRDASGRDREQVAMNRIFNDPTRLYRDGGLDRAIRGMLHHQSERFDGVFTEEVKNLLFASRNQSFGLDLMSINIQRGRDHGLPTYNQIRQLCSLEPVRDFRQLQSLLADPDDWQRLQQVYEHVDDIDYWVAGNLERPIPGGGALGPTFSCVVGEQFRRLKYGDRFWYENGNMAHSFTEQQLTEIRKVTLAGIICQNGDGRQRRIQPLAMLAVSQQNPELDCSLIPQMDLSAWQSRRFF